jgi:hypothetical protein
MEKNIIFRLKSEVWQREILEKLKERELINKINTKPSLIEGLKNNN